MIDWTEALANCSVRAPAPAPSAGLPKDELLAGFHPDHAPGAMTTLSVGVSAGLRCPSALADLLQSNALVEDVDIAGALTRTTDVLVIGAGGAGCVAALTAARDGARVILATKLRMGDGNTVMAEGGIQAAVGQDDSLQRHFDDTLRAERVPELLRGGGFLAGHLGGAGGGGLGVRRPGVVVALALLAREVLGLGRLALTVTWPGGLCRRGATGGRDGQRGRGGDSGGDY